jgi:hypothetical protein
MTRTRSLASIVPTAAFAGMLAVSLPLHAQSGLSTSSQLLSASSAFSIKSVDPNGRPGSWQPLTHQPQIPEIIDSHGNDYGPGGAGGPLLMTDGTVLVQDWGVYGEDVRIFKLTPDIWGSYVNGTWSELAPKPYNAANGAQAVLADGRVLIEGGEDSGYPYYFTLTNTGAMYDPVSNLWASVNPPPFFEDLYPPRAVFAPNPIGDAPSVVLADGTFMMQDKMSRQGALLDLKTMTWTQTGTSTKDGLNDEEGLNLLPNGEVLTIDCYTDFYFGLAPEYPTNPTGSEIYNPRTGNWASAGSTIHTLTDPVLNEMGPAVLLPSGKVFAVGSNGDSSIYDSNTRMWSLGPSLPISPQGYQYTVQDGPGVLLPDGNVLIAASGGPETSDNGDYSTPPVAFFEYDSDANVLHPEPTIPNAANDESYTISLLPLPNGQVMSVDLTTDVEIYTPANTAHNPQWAPVNESVPFRLAPGGTYKLEGSQLNGLSQGCNFGDELQCATNYPLVRMTNLETKHVFYSRTHDHSSMGVSKGNRSSTHFDVPLAQEKGLNLLVVVANGIASAPALVIVE